MGLGGGAGGVGGCEAPLQPYCEVYWLIPEEAERYELKVPHDEALGVYKLALT